MATKQLKSYSVNFWGSHPNAGNDDCYCGEDFATVAEARAYFTDPSRWGTYVIDCSHVELASGERSQDGALWVKTIKVRKNPEYQASQQDDKDWRNEIATQAGMLGGIEAYNEALGSN